MFSETLYTPGSVPFPLFFIRDLGVLNLFERYGFSMIKGFSTLFQFPSNEPLNEKPREGLDSKAGFWAVLFEKR
ncbi:hypothetical protein TH606_03030 [Thermodesulfatator autotrophicus]|uniref:Methyltransferase n=1 Tax=Thermodesulfatator autotrophicus TaxID=1795632 RepID=A0A177EAU1_9BACT|nr:hypothetical protein TH606_03030 [Thermodesulfatator autotrophicus]